eukprot:m.16524 g.16524  ORF g.16524 m.16524 type:complete len:315 (+) comp8013_c0_seq1:100-1044(+)
MFGGFRLLRRFVAPIKTSSVGLAIARTSRPAKGNVVQAISSTATGTAASSTTTRRIIVGVLSAAGVVAIGLMGGNVVKGMAQANTLHDNTVWPQYVRERVSNTFGAFAYSVVATAAATTVLYRSGAANFFARSPILSIIVGFGAMVLTSSITRAVDNDNIVLKYGALTAFNVAVGFAISPIAALGGSVVRRAALITGGIVGSLAFVAANAPSDTFLMWGGPLAMGLGGVCIANIAAIFVPSVAAASVLQIISVYGGLAVFSGLCLYDTAVIIEKAKAAPKGKFDAVGESIHIFMDAINIFIRIATILSGGGKKK